MIKFNLYQKISTQLAFTIILVLSFLTAWLTLNEAQKIIENSKQSPAFNIEKRIQKEIPANNRPAHK